MVGTANDLITLFSGYAWAENVRSENNRGIVPGIFHSTQFGNRPVDSDTILITTGLAHGIEKMSGVVAIRARIFISIQCFSKSLAIASQLADAIWTILFATEDTNGDKNYISSNFDTINKIPPTTFSILTPTRQANGYWSTVINFEAETQQSNTN